MEYHQSRFVDQSLMICKEDKVIGLFPANVVNNEVYSHQGLTYGGLLVSESIKLKEYAKCLKEILSFYKNKNLSKLTIKILPSIYSHLPQDELLYFMFILDAELIRRDALSVLQLNHKSKVSKDRLAGHKRALKHDLIIKEVNDFSAFWNELLIPNLKAKHSAHPVHSLEEITMLKEKFPRNIRQFNVYLQDQLVAGTTIFETKNVAHSQYISGNTDNNSLGSLDFLHMHLINEVFKNKSYFDFGISNENQGRQINAGLNYWKEGFGARTVTQDFYTIDLNNVGQLDTIFI